MTIYILLISFLIITRLGLKKHRKAFCIITTFALYALVALRSVNMGIGDTANIYYFTFKQARIMSWKSLFSYIMPDRIFFLFITKSIGIFIKNYHLYLAIIGLPYVLSVSWLIYRYSKRPLLSYICFMALYYLYSFFLLRQVLAMAITTYSYKYITEGSIRKYLISCLIATLIHSSAIVFLIAYPFARKIKFGWRNYVYIFISLIVSFIGSNLVLTIVNKINPTTGSYIKAGVYQTDQGLSMFGFVITFLILIFCHITRKKNNSDDYLYNLSTLGSMLYALTNVVAEFYRVSLYFSIFNILLIAETIPYLKLKDNRKILYAVLISLMIAYFLIRTINNIHANPYEFLWME